MVYVDAGRCSGCGLCVEACPSGAMRLVDGMARVEPSLCHECEACLEACPQGAILSVREPVRVARPIPARPPAPVAPRPAAGLLPLLGTAPAFVGREVVPRVVTALLERQSRLPAGPASELVTSAGGATRTAGRGQRWRLRRRGRL